LWSRAFASAKSNSLNGELEGQNSEKETACDSEKKFYAIIFGSGIAASTDIVEIKDPLVYAVS